MKNVNASVGALPFRGLACAVIEDAIINVRKDNEYSRQSFLFLSGRVGDLDMWLEMVRDVDADALRNGIDSFLKKHHVAPGKATGRKSRRTGPNRVVLVYADGRKTNPEAVIEKYGVNYTTLVNRHSRRPDLPVEELVLKKIPPLQGTKSVFLARDNGNTISLSDGAYLLGMPYSTLYHRHRGNPGKTLEQLAVIGKKKYEVEM